jgi:putative DNA primase/helicase
MSHDKFTVIPTKNKQDLINILEAEEPGCTKTIEIKPRTNELIQSAFSAIKPRSIEWLWYKRIARGKVTIFAGEPGKGKSQLLLWIAAACSNGWLMPVDKAQFVQGKVAILSAEDDEDDTITPRLLALNANLAMIFQLKSHPRRDNEGKLLDSTVCLDGDLQLLDNTFANNPGYVCMIIDPITAYLGKTNDNKNSDVRTLITNLTNIAKKHNIAIILNTHLSKPAGNSQTSAMNRVIGSIAYVAAARAAYLICDNEDDRKIKQFIPMKNNVGDDLTGFEYRVKGITIQEGIETSHIEWLPNSIQKNADEAVNKTPAAPRRDHAIEFLKEKLKNGSMLLIDLRRQADEANISTYNFYKAKEALNVIEDETTQRPIRKIWTLPIIS